MGRDAVVAVVVVRCPEGAEALAGLHERLVKRSVELDGVRIHVNAGELFASLSFGQVRAEKAVELVGWVASVVVEAEAALGVEFEVEIQTEMEW